MWTLKYLFWLYFRMKGCFMVICFWKCTGLRKCFVFTEGSMQRWGTCLADYRQEAQISRIPCLCTFVCFKGSAKSDSWVPPGPTFTLRSKGIKDPGDNTNLMATSDMRRKSVSLCAESGLSWTGVCEQAGNAATAGTFLHLPTQWMQASSTSLKPKPSYRLSDSCRLRTNLQGLIAVAFDSF